MDINEMKEWYLIPLKKYVDYEGRVSRVKVVLFH